ncbi:GIY-YIG nuclease family protein [Leeia oryzae]|uniref:GIY-YIG nuclease family protein n=1 Tax=Leeia oryzae TaxID=356662 RepID=UPI0003797ECA|nr:GIY-YIG nuclease family protein [Leeia oryzae]
MTEGSTALPDDTWWVYLLLCKGDRIYTGIARDVLNRCQLHATGKGARFTRSFPPVRLLACKRFDDRTGAAREEILTKRLDRPAKLAKADDWGCPVDWPAAS